jgi:hypothetical protein
MGSAKYLGTMDEWMRDQEKRVTSVERRRRRRLDESNSSSEPQVPAFGSNLNLAPYLVDGVWLFDSGAISNYVLNLPAAATPAGWSNYTPNPTNNALYAVTSITNNPAAWTVTRGVTVTATPAGTLTADSVAPTGSPLGSGYIASIYNIDGLANTFASYRRVKATIYTNAPNAEYRVWGSPGTAPGWTPMASNVWVVTPEVVLTPNQYAIFEVRPRDGALPVAGQVALITDVSASPGPGQVRSGPIGVLRVTATPSQVEQRFEQLVPVAVGPPRVMDHTRYKTAGGEWGPWILDHGIAPTRTAADQYYLGMFTAQPRTPGMNLDSVLDTRAMWNNNPSPWWTADGNTIHGGSGVAVDSAAWLPITLTAPWVAYLTPTWVTAMVMRTVDGIVKLRGVIKSGSVGSIVGTLPAGYRPHVRRAFYCWAACPSEGVGRIDITPDGVMRLTSFNGSTAAVASSFLSLGEVMFPCAEAAPPGEWKPLTLLNGWADYMASVEKTFGPASYWVDSVGRVWLSGLIYRPAGLPGAVATVSWPTELGIAGYDAVPALSSGTSGFAMFNVGLPASTLTLRLAGTPGAAWLSFPSMPMIPATIAPTAAWTTLPLTAAWINYGGTYSPASLWRAQDGLIHHRGLVSAGAVPSQVAVLPVGFRPTATAGQELNGTIAADAQARNDLRSTDLFAQNGGPGTWRSLTNYVYLWEG